MKLAHSVTVAVATTVAFFTSVPPVVSGEDEDVAWVFEDTEYWPFSDPLFDPEEHSVTYPSSLIDSPIDVVQNSGCEQLTCELGEFCGKDLQCHPFNCQNWYTLAHPYYNKYRSDISEELVCNPVPEDGKDRTYLHNNVFCTHDGYYPNAIFYTPPQETNSTGDCSERRICRDVLDETEELAGITFNRKCTAVPQKGFGFVCYDMDPSINLDEDIDAYLETVSRLNGQDDYLLPESRDIVIEDSNTSGYHSYASLATSLNIFMTDIDASRDPSTGFEANLLRNTMAAELFSQRRDDLLEASFPVCPEGCPILQFCGTDMTCHSYNCENIYRFAPKRYSGNRLTNLKSLVCSTDPPQEDLPCGEYGGGWPIAIQYTPFQSWSGCATFRGAEPFRYNRQCRAKGFECYDIAADDLDLLSLALEDFRNASVSHEFKEESALHPRYLYQTSIRTPGLAGDGTHTSSWQYDLDIERVQALVRSSYSPAATTAGNPAMFFMLYLCWGFLSLFALS